MPVETGHKEYEALATALRGRLVDRGHPGYDEARAVYNAMIDRRPRLIVECADVADVISAVRFGVENRLPIAIRGGGHNGPGLCVCDDGLVIDVKPMRYVRVDPARGEARVGAGCVWGDVDHATQPFGLAVPTGIVSTTGVPGLTLGGGHGYLARKYGLTIDNLLSADVVLADGRLVTASEQENQDLFWAIRGGGGNFGVVTSFLFKCRPVSSVHGGVMLWRFEQARDVLRWYPKFILQAPEDLYGFLAIMRVPPAAPFPESLHKKTVCGIVWCYLGPSEAAEAAFEPVRRFTPPAFEHLGQMPFAALQSLFDTLLPRGLQWYWKGDFVNDVPEEAINAHLEFGGRIPSLLSTMHLYPIDGAVHRVGKGDTAFSHRDVNFSMVIAGIDSDPANAKKISEWAQRYWEAVHPYSAGAAYVNFMMDEGEERVKATYRENYPRLAQIKAQYDPENVFRLNQNIKPAKGKKPV
jgi:FAD/FMN-containing dehydrogenase